MLISLLLFRGGASVAPPPPPPDPPPVSSESMWGIFIDLNADGFFAEAGENVTSDVLVDAGYGEIRTERGREQMRSLSPPKAGAADFMLNNSSNAYGPTSNVKRGRHARIRATYEAIVYDVFRGPLDYPVREPGVGFKRVGISCLGTFTRLIDKDTLTSALYQSITTDAAMGVVLDAAGWPSGERVMDVGQTVLDWWWLDGESAWDAIQALLWSEGPGAVIYEDGAGRFVFKNRHARLTETRSLSSQATYGMSGIQIEAPLTYEDGLKDVINICEVETKTRSAKALASVWELGSTITLGPDETRKYIASSSDPFTGAITPQPVIDYVLTSGSATVSLDRTSGTSVTITITAGAGGAIINDLHLWANPVTVDSTTRVANTVDTSASQSEHGKRPFKLAVRSEIDVDAAQDFCNAVVGHYQNGRPRVSFLASGSQSPTATISNLSRQISDRITLDEPSVPLVAEPFCIEQIRHEVQYGGGLFRTTFGCEKIEATSNFWVLGTSTLGITTRAGY